MTKWFLVILFILIILGVGVWCFWDTLDVLMLGEIVV